MKLISGMNPVELAEETEKITRLRKEFDDYWKSEGPVFATMFGVEVGGNQPVSIVAWNAYLKGRSVEKPKCDWAEGRHYWETGCDVTTEFSIDIKQPRFCPFCGGEIEVKP